MTNHEAIQFLHNMIGEEQGRSIGAEGFYRELCAYHVGALKIAIKALEQESKTGHWIIHGEPPINVIECSECGQKYHNHYCQPLAHFCSMCGCRMVEPQESEVDNG